MQVFVNAFGPFSPQERIVRAGQVLPHSGRSAVYAVYVAIAHWAFWAIVILWIGGLAAVLGLCIFGPIGDEDDPPHQSRPKGAAALGSEICPS